MPSEKINWTIHVDPKGNAMCEFKYDNQVLVLPFEHVNDFSVRLDEWLKAVLLESKE